MANALTQFSRDLAATIDATSPAIVAVHGRGRFPSSGIVWEPGLVVTAEETVARCRMWNRRSIRPDRKSVV